MSWFLRYQASYELSGWGVPPRRFIWFKAGDLSWFLRYQASYELSGWGVPPGDLW